MKNFHLTIEKPCTENWQNFEPTHQGGFCQTCVKEVIDFSEMSDQEIKQYFKNHASQNICGKLKTSQLKTYDTSVQFSINNQWMKVAFIAGFIHLVSLPLSLSAQTNHKTEQIVTTKDSQTNQKDELLNEQFIISGQVLEEDSNWGFPGVNVILKGTAFGVITDIDGNFKIEIPKGHSNPILQFSFIGSVTQEINISKNQMMPLIVKLAPDKLNLLGEVIVVGGVSANSKFGLRNWFGTRHLYRKVKNIF